MKIQFAEQSIGEERRELHRKRASETHRRFPQRIQSNIDKPIRVRKTAEGQKKKDPKGSQ